MAQRGLWWAILAAAGVAGAAVYESRRPSASGTPHTIPGLQTTIVGPSGAVQVDVPGYLPDIHTSFTNTSTGVEVIQISAVAMVYAAGSTQLLIDTRPGHGYPGGGVSGAPSGIKTEVSLSPGETVVLPWTMAVSGSTPKGPYTIQVSIEGVSGVPNATFTDSTTWTLDVLSKPEANVSFTGGPTGTIDLQIGETTTLASLTTVLSNTGQGTGTFSMGVQSVDTNSTSVISWLTSTGLASESFVLSGGASATMTWTATISNAQAAEAGTYSNQADVSW